MGLRCSQCSLIIINSVFALIGLVLFIFGCLLKFGSDHVEDYMIDKVSGTLTFMRSAGSDGNMVNFDLGEYLSTFAFILIAIGAFFLVISILGCCGGIGKIRCFLIMYAAIIVLLVLVEVATIIAVMGFSSKVKDAIKEPMYTSLRNEYQGINSSDVTSAGWNFLMVVFQCCGVENSNDFQLANKWSKKITIPGQLINGSLTLTSPPITVVLTIPVACCKAIGTFPQVTLPENSNYTCALSPTQANSNMNKGCAESVVTYIKDHYIYVVTGAGIIVASQIIMLLMSVCLLQAIIRRRNFDKELQRMFRDD